LPDYLIHTALTSLWHSAIGERTLFSFADGRFVFGNDLLQSEPRTNLNKITG